MQEVEAICNRVIIINKGEIVADDKLENLQRRKTDRHVVVVHFKEQVDASSLQGLSNVNLIKQLNDRSYKLETSQPDEVRKQILQLALQHNLNIVSLQDESYSLEDGCRALTGDPDKKSV